MKTAYLVAGLGYGDEGKGATVDFLVRSKKATLVIRYNGGAQAAHNVVTPSGLHHTFAQFGSGTFVPGVKTHLSRFMIVNPLNMIREEEHLQELGIEDAFHRTTIDEGAIVVTPFHRAVNRILEYSRSNPNGSCGQGIGQARSNHIKYGNKVLFIGDLRAASVTKEKLEFIQKVSLNTITNLRFNRFYRGLDEVDNEYALLQSNHIINQMVRDYCNFASKVKIVDSKFLKNALMFDDWISVFEGAQGMLLDEIYGEKDHNTWTDCTFNNAIKLLDESEFNGGVVRVGVLRSYFTRHGQGEFIEDPTMCYPEEHNDSTGFQGKFRIGKLDLKKIQYSLDSIGGVDLIALNHLDMCSTIPETIAPLVKITSHGPTALSRKEWKESYFSPHKRLANSVTYPGLI